MAATGPHTSGAANVEAVLPWCAHRKPVYTQEVRVRQGTQGYDRVHGSTRPDGASLGQKRSSGERLKNAQRWSRLRLTAPLLVQEVISIADMVSLVERKRTSWKDTSTKSKGAAKQLQEHRRSAPKGAASRCTKQSRETSKDFPCSEGATGSHCA